jgi:hypothetical protein
MLFDENGQDADEMVESHDPWAAATGTQPPAASPGSDPFATLRDALRGDHGLPARQARILRLRFGLDDCVPATSDQVSIVFGVTRERVRQLERSALGALGLGDLRSPAAARTRDEHGYRARDDGSPIADAVRSLTDGRKWWRIDQDTWTDGERSGPWTEITPGPWGSDHWMLPCRASTETAVPDDNAQARVASAAASEHQ